MKLSNYVDTTITAQKFSFITAITVSKIFIMKLKQQIIGLDYQWDDLMRLRLGAFISVVISSHKL